jgi:nucleoside-diphosphate-sugar epimerase
MNVLVTGGTGFLGGYTVAELQNSGQRAIAYDISPPTGEVLAACPSIQNFEPGEITDLDRLIGLCQTEKVEAIIHTAGKVGLEASLRNPAEFYRTNIMGMVTVCEVARRLGLRKVILISSNAVYHRPIGDKLTETDPVFFIDHANPAAHYGVSKLATEAIGMSYAQFHDIDFIGLRMTAIYGFGMRSPMYIKPMVENAVAGKPTRFPTGGQMKRDYTHVLDCVRAIIRALNASRLEANSQRVFNIAAGRVYSAAEVANVIRRIIPSADIEIGDTLTALEEENVKMRAALDISAAKRILGWEPEFAIEDGIRQYSAKFSDYLQIRQ